LVKHDVPISAAVKANGFVFVAGTPPIDPDNGKLVNGDIEQQTGTVMRHLEKVLTASGSSSDRVVKVTLLAANSANFARINEVYHRYFPHQPPARTFVTVGSWPMEFDIEIECVSLADRSAVRGKSALAGPHQADWHAGRSVR
jgi:2-iminobutanoate/2-iminopropanoate deaminase